MTERARDIAARVETFVREVVVPYARLQAGPSAVNCAARSLRCTLGHCCYSKWGNTPFTPFTVNLRPRLKQIA